MKTMNNERPQNINNLIHTMEKQSIEELKKQTQEDILLKIMVASPLLIFLILLYIGVCV